MTSFLLPSNIEKINTRERGAPKEKIEKCEKCNMTIDFIDKIYKPKLISMHNLNTKNMCSKCLVELIVDRANRTTLDL